MRRVRLVVLLSSAGLAAAVIAGTIAARTAEPARGALPRQAAFLPPDARFVIGVDLRRVIESPAYKRFNTGPLEKRKQDWEELERRTGIDVERDLTHMIAAGSGRSDDSGLALLLGKFERGRTETALSAGAAGTAREYAGRKLWMMEPRLGDKAQAVAVLEDGVLAAGAPAEVEAAIDRHKAKGPGLMENAAMAALVAKIDPRSTFWMCGDQGLLSAVGGASSQTAGWTIPAIKTFVASGDLDPDLSAVVLAQTADDASAKSVVDMLRGLLGLLMMQSGQQPALKDLAAGLAIDQVGSEVKIAARFSYDTLSRLAPVPTATPVPSPTPAARKAPNPR